MKHVLSIPNTNETGFDYANGSSVGTRWGRRDLDLDSTLMTPCRYQATMKRE